MEGGREGKMESGREGGREGGRKGGRRKGGREVHVGKGGGKEGEVNIGNDQQLPISPYSSGYEGHLLATLSACTVCGRG